ncbi:hypothetical protein V5P93_005658 [Actinokineospora auranticolor]|uniref:Uncharacterized protein n=1 Tax=Actinokineospora auranticolor TaxID=155976 RepID=A0A2S6GF02_9PSEU|nr:hypothetical protein [Actinokineospora auranticolor]PPK63789.1 hypothetical protein CLV40_12429 [Actinokineospora auranticolor]
MPWRESLGWIAEQALEMTVLHNAIRAMPRFLALGVLRFRRPG